MDPYTTVKKTYNQIAQVYTDRYKDSPFMLSHLKKFSSLIKKNGKILDLGCGSGRAVKFFFKEGFDVVGIDFSEEMLNLAKKNIPKGKFLLMDMRDLNFLKESFDAVWSHFSILHIPKKDIAQVFSECERVIKKNGLFFIAVSLGKDTEGFEDEWLKKGNKTFFHVISKNSLKKYLERSGFTVISLNIVGDAKENDNVPILYAYAIKD